MRPAAFPIAGHDSTRPVRTVGSLVADARKPVSMTVAVTASVTGAPCPAVATPTRTRS